MKGTVLFICGGKWQKPWFQFLKNKGHQIILVDPGEKPECLALADEHICLDARNISGIIKEVTSRNLKIDLITSDQTDVACDSVAVLCESLNIQSNKPEIVKLFTNKFRNRKFLKEGQFAHYPDFREVTTLQDIDGFIGTASHFEYILKPSDSQSSRGVFVLNQTNRHQWSQYLQQSITYSNSGQCIVEEFVNGTEFTVEGICLNGKHTTLAISRKKHFRTGIASELRYIPNFKFEDKLTQFHNHFVQATNLINSITHAEYILNEETGKFWMVECACRGGGTLIPSHIVPWVSGCDVYETYYNAITGQAVEPFLPPKIKKAAALFFFEFNSGKVVAIEGLETAKQLPGVVRLELEFTEGDILYPAADDRGRQGFAIVVAENEQQLESRMEQVRQAIKVQVLPKIEKSV